MNMTYILSGYKTFKYKTEPAPILPDELIKTLDSIKQFLEDHCDDDLPYCCPLKLAHVDFLYKDEWYSITPDTFDIRKISKRMAVLAEEYFDLMSNKIIEILKDKINVSDTYYHAMVD